MNLAKKQLGIRHLQCLLLFFCLCVSYMMRVNLSIGIVLMTDPTKAAGAKVFNWTVAQQSASQSVFFVGYFFLNLAAAVLVTMLNAKYLLLFSVALCSALTLATPFLVTIGDYYALVAIRFGLGALQGLMMASIFGVMSKWIPPGERSRCGALVLGGIHIGNLISFSASGWIGSNYGGWPSIFYFSGLVGVVWVLLWLFLGAESPSECSLVSKQELNYIEKELAETPTLPKNLAIPWREMLCSKACWGLVLATLGHNWGFWTLVTEIPSYFNSVMQFSATINGLVSSLPYACMWVISMVASVLSDKLVKSGRITANFSRKFNNSIGHYGAAVCLIVLSLTTHASVAISMYILGTSLLAFAYIGYNINHFDITPNFAGFLMGITNGLSNICSFSGPLVSGLIVTDASNVGEWRIVFIISALIFFIGNTFFIILGSATVQPFNKIPQEHEENREEAVKDTKMPSA